MRKLFRLINHFCWKHYGFAFRVVHPAHKFKPIDGRMYFVYTGLSNFGYKAIYRDGKYRSIVDGHIVEFITKVQEFI